MDKIKRNAVAVFFIIALAGCTSLPKDYGRSDIDFLLSERGISKNEIADGQLHAYVQSLINKPLTAESATQITLINNAELKKNYAQLGLAAADVYEAGRIRNPIFSYSVLDSNQSGERDLITLGFITSLADMITLPSRKKLAEAQFAATKQSIAADVLRTVRQVQIAFYASMAAEQIALVKSQMHKTTELSSQLAHRYHQAGNISDRELLEEDARASEAKFEMLDANAAALLARTELANLLGLTVDQSWQIESGLPLPVQADERVNDLVAVAMQSRLDLIAVNMQAERLAHNLGVTNWTRYLGDLDIGVERERETDGAKLTGPVVEWEVPIFTQHNDAKLRAASELQTAIVEVARLSNEIHNEVHLNFLKASGAKTRVHEYAQAYIPTKSAIVERAQEEENFMLIGTFELLQTKLEEYESYVGYIESISGYWIAHTNLMHAVGDSLAVATSEEEQKFNFNDLLTTNSDAAKNNAHAHH